MTRPKLARGILGLTVASVGLLPVVAATPTAMRGGDAAQANGMSRPSADPRPPACIGDNPHGNYGFEVIIAEPQNHWPPEMDAATIRQAIHAANGVFFEAAQASSDNVGADLVFECEGGVAAVNLFVLPFDHDNDSWSKLERELIEAGYDNKRRKYVVWYDEELPVPCVFAQGRDNDDSPGEDNLNNTTDGELDFSFLQGCGGGLYFLLHEMTHTLGAVQSSAPHFFNSNGNHCYDFYDTMCHIVEGPVEEYCPLPGTFDCHKDDYFDAKLGAGEGGPNAPGNYLYDHWNIGSCVARWVVNYSCSAQPRVGEARGVR